MFVQLDACSMLTNTITPNPGRSKSDLSRLEHKVSVYGLMATAFAARVEAIGKRPGALSLGQQCGSSICFADVVHFLSLSRDLFAPTLTEYLNALGHDAILDAASGDAEDLEAEIVDGPLEEIPSPLSNKAGTTFATKGGNEAQPTSSDDDKETPAAKAERSFRELLSKNEKLPSRRAVREHAHVNNNVASSVCKRLKLSEEFYPEMVEQALTDFI